MLTESGRLSQLGLVASVSPDQVPDHVKVGKGGGKDRPSIGREG